MQEIVKKYEKVIKNVDDDILTAKGFIEDLEKDYVYLKKLSNDTRGCINLDDRIKLQSMILKIGDLIANKRVNKVELERQLAELKEDIKKRDLKSE